MTEPPIGFEYAADGVTLIPNQCEQKFMEVVVSLFRKGMSLQKIAEEIEAAQKATSKTQYNWTAQMVATLVDRYNATE